MKNKNFLLKYLVYLFLVFPMLIISVEVILHGYYKINKVIFPRPLGGALKYDPITGWRGYISHEPLTDKKNPITFNKYGFVKFSDIDSDRGIIFLGDSVTQGVLSSGNNYIFSSLLQKKLEKDNYKVINLAFSSFNSWMENAELNRYLNFYKGDKNLPSPEVVISLGGIQDFWRFVNNLENRVSNKYSFYKDSYGLMMSDRFIKYSTDIFSVMEGNILNSFEVLFSSIKVNFLKNSSSAQLLRELKNNLITKKEITLKDRFSNMEISNKEYKKKINASQLITEINKSNNIKISSERYIYLRNLSIDSLVRNLKSNIAILDKNKFVYVYSPSMLSTLPIDPKYREILLLTPDKSVFDFYTLQLIENDYRKNLLNKISSIENLYLLDYSQIINNLHSSYFNDNSHFTDKGHELVSEKLHEDLRKLMLIK